MSTAADSYQRGSEWRKWDLHIHTPASFHWTGQRFEADVESSVNRGLVDQMISAINAAEPAVFALMDYWTFDGWFALQKRLKENGAPKLTKTVFPGIELRLVSPTRHRLNAHAIFSEKISDQALYDFKSKLELAIINRPLSSPALIDYARSVGVDKLQKHGFKKEDVETSEETALLAGSAIAEIVCDTYKSAIESVAGDQAVGFMPYDTSDGLAGVKWHEHYAYFISLFRSSPIFESRNLELRNAFVNQVTPANKGFIDDFQKGLGNVPRLVVSGSDAHKFVGVKGDNDSRGYGDFPSEKTTWIKADPTFRGLLQAIMEPSKRSFIGSCPEKHQEVSENKTYFIDRISIQKATPATPAAPWLDNTSIPLNYDLVAIIGNKGSGKSALADVIALLGNSKQKTHFSFLRKDRFRGRSGEPARHFIGTMTWLDRSNPESRCLNDDPPADKAELVRYIPQGHFEDLCNSHVSGKSSAFEQELRSVIFSHAGDGIRLGALDFDQLIDRQESSARDHLEELRKDLRRLNYDISAMEDQLQPGVESALQELLKLKVRQIAELAKLEPQAVPPPTEAISDEQKVATEKLDQVRLQLNQIEIDQTSINSSSSTIAAKLKAIGNLKERMSLLSRYYKSFLQESGEDMGVLKFQPSQLAVLEMHPEKLDALSAEISIELTTNHNKSIIIGANKVLLVEEQNRLTDSLNAPQRAYQQFLAEHKDWEVKLSDLRGTPEAPETHAGLSARIAQIKLLPTTLAEYRHKRKTLCAEIFTVIESQRSLRESLFKPVQSLIQNNALIREEYKLQFRATIGCSPDVLAGALFSLIKQNSGEFRGEEESYNAIRKFVDNSDFVNVTDAVDFADGLYEKITAAAKATASPVALNNILRKDRSASEVYDLLFGLTYLEPRYSLLFQGAQIEQLSPGQRGALLLIFYLLVDKGKNPIILDQPEENLDNETIVSLLVPVLTEAKRRRQIIMVTHNPNLAVVCDAEQVIQSTFDRQAGPKISYCAGSIENPAMNLHVINVLEGTRPAFDNRRRKYL